MTVFIAYFKRIRTKNVFVAEGYAKTQLWTFNKQKGSTILMIFVSQQAHLRLKVIKIYYKCFFSQRVELLGSNVRIQTKVHILIFPPYETEN